MKLELEVATILNRYKRFLADVKLSSGEIITVHTTNTGPMTSCWEPGWKCAISKSNNPNRKLTHTLEMTNNGSSWIGVNTHLANHLVKEGLVNKVISELNHFDKITSEVKYGKNSRIDFLLENEKDKFYLEVKSVSLKYPNSDIVYFPDTPSERALKHVQELSDMIKEGHQAGILFLVQREDVSKFQPATAIQPEYTQALIKAQKAGLKIFVYQCQVSPNEIILARSLPYELV